MTNYFNFVLLPSGLHLPVNLNLNSNIIETIAPAATVRLSPGPLAVNEYGSAAVLALPHVTGVGWGELGTPGRVATPINPTTMTHQHYQQQPPQQQQHQQHQLFHQPQQQQQQQQQHQLFHQQQPYPGSRGQGFTPGKVLLLIFIFLIKSLVLFLCFIFKVQELVKLVPTNINPNPQAITVQNRIVCVSTHSSHFNQSMEEVRLYDLLHPGQ